MDVLAAGPGMASPSRLAREHMEAASASASAFGVWRLAFEQMNQPDLRRNNNPDTTIITIGGNAYAIR